MVLKEFNNSTNTHSIKHRETLNFLKAFIINPRATGSILPSSKRLAKLMVSFDEIDKKRLTIELGPGTGVVTQALLDAGVPAKQLVAIEYSPHMVEALTRKFPEIKIINGNAAQLSDLLKNEMRQVGTVISGLPLRSLPKEMRESILDEIYKILTHGGHYIQFTYDFRKKRGFYPEIYHLKKSKIVWRNIPPAKIQLFTFGKQCNENHN
jgi:phospholipid N-methyltransferase